MKTLKLEGDTAYCPQLLQKKTLDISKIDQKLCTSRNQIFPCFVQFCYIFASALQNLALQFCECMCNSINKRLCVYGWMCLCGGNIEAVVELTS